MDYLAVWCNNNDEEAETPVFLQAEILLPETESLCLVS